LFAAKDADPVIGAPFATEGFSGNARMRTVANRRHIQSACLHFHSN
jgi:hypothetical protein